MIIFLLKFGKFFQRVNEEDLVSIEPEFFKHDQFFQGTIKYMRAVIIYLISEMLL